MTGEKLGKIKEGIYGVSFAVDRILFEGRYPGEGVVVQDFAPL